MVHRDYRFVSRSTLPFGLLPIGSSSVGGQCRTVQDTPDCTAPASKNFAGPRAMMMRSVATTAKSTEAAMVRRRGRRRTVMCGKRRNLLDVSHGRTPPSAVARAEFCAAHEGPGL